MPNLLNVKLSSSSAKTSPVHHPMTQTPTLKILDMKMPIKTPTTIDRASMSQITA